MERDGKHSSGASTDLAQSGLLKLMLRLPSIRGRLQILASHSPSLMELCEAYGEASAALERLENGRLSQEADLLAEYRSVCSEIEADVIKYCLDNRDSTLK